MHPRKGWMANCSFAQYLSHHSQFYISRSLRWKKSHLFVHNLRQTCRVKNLLAPQASPKIENQNLPWKDTDFWTNKGWGDAVKKVQRVKSHIIALLANSLPKDLIQPWPSQVTEFPTKPRSGYRPTGSPEFLLHYKFDYFDKFLIQDVSIFVRFSGFKKLVFTLSNDWFGHLE